MAVFVVMVVFLLVQLLPSSTTAQASNGTICSEGDIRLRDGVRPSTGRVEICYNNAWGTVCDDGWSNVDAEVACRQLGFPGHRAVLTGTRVVDGRGQIVLDDVLCRGNESRLVDCFHRGLGVNNCGHNEDAGVSCYEACEGDNITIRLVEGRSEYEGLIEVCTNNSVGTVCDRSWTTADATVVCRQLGYSELGAVPRMRDYFSSGRNTEYYAFPVSAVLGDIVCNGNEGQLVDCQHPGFGNQVCSSSENVGVSCQPPGTEAMCTDGDIRLVDVDGSSTPVTEGRFQYCYGSVWGAVCRTGFDDIAASVVCRELGIANAGISTSYYDSLESVYRVLLLDSTGCTGDESRFSECSAGAIGDTADYYGDCSGEVGVRCITGLFLVKKLSGGEIFAIIFCYLLFVGSIIVLVLGLACYKQRQYKKLVRTRSSSDSSSDVHPPTNSETAQRVEQVGVATPDDPSSNLDAATHNASEPPPPAYCETSEQYHTAEQNLL